MLTNEHKSAKYTHISPPLPYITWGLILDLKTNRDFDTYFLTSLISKLKQEILIIIND